MAMSVQVVLSVWILMLVLPLRAREEDMLSREQMRIDTLAASVRTEEDAITYINAAFPFDEPSFTWLSAFKQRLAKAEVASLNGSPVVSDLQVSEAFNYMMTQIGAPEWAMSSEPGIHSFRETLAKVHPHLVSRDSSGRVATSSRPVEALYVLFLLERNPDFFRKRSSGVAPPSPTGAPTSSLRPVERSAAEQEYLSARTKYFATHSSRVLEEDLRIIFVKLGI